MLVPPARVLCRLWESRALLRSVALSESSQQRYRVIERLASGGMAEVFLAESAGIEGFKKRVAIKRVLPHLSENKRFIAMFLDEARLSAHLTHSQIAQVFDIGVGDNAYFIVMEYVDGSDLKGLIEHHRKTSKPFPVECAVYIAVKICEGLAYAHELTNPAGQPLNIVHRDMSPPNVLITRFGEVKIVDFGLAKASSQLEKSEAGIIKGKFGYLSPEAALGLEVDHRTDIFAVGIILWELIAGRRLFQGESDYQTVKLVQEAQVPSLRAMGMDIPEALDRIVLKSLAKDPVNRHLNASDLSLALTEFLFKSGRPVGNLHIARLVREASAQRKQGKADKGTLIDKLIEEALFEFTSLQDGQQGADRVSDVRGSARPSAFEDISKWVEEMKMTASAPGIDPGAELASLEDSYHPPEPDEAGPQEKVPPPAALPSSDGSRFAQLAAERASMAAPQPKRPIWLWLGLFVVAALVVTIAVILSTRR